MKLGQQNKYFQASILLLMTLLTLAACQRSSNKSDQAIELNTSFFLNVGDSATLASEVMKITFIEVPEDSRCPTEVTCFWTGQVSVLLGVEKNDEDWGNHLLTLNPAPAGQSLDEVVLGNVIIQLKAVTPYPGTPDSLSADGYTAELLVTGNSS